MSNPIQKALTQAAMDLGHLLSTNGAAIESDLAHALTEFARRSADTGNREFSFPVSVAIKLTPRGERCKVNARIRWNVQKSDEIETIVNEQQALPFEE